MRRLLGSIHGALDVYIHDKPPPGFVDLLSSTRFRWGISWHYHLEGKFDFLHRNDRLRFITLESRAPQSESHHPLVGVCTLERYDARLEPDLVHVIARRHLVIRPCYRRNGLATELRRFIIQVRPSALYDDLPKTPLSADRALPAPTEEEEDATASHAAASWFVPDDDSDTTKTEERSPPLGTAPRVVTRSVPSSEYLAAAVARASSNDLAPDADAVAGAASDANTSPPAPGGLVVHAAVVARGTTRGSAGRLDLLPLAPGAPPLLCKVAQPIRIAVGVLPPQRLRAALPWAAKAAAPTTITDLVRGIRAARAHARAAPSATRSGGATAATARSDAAGGGAAGTLSFHVQRGRAAPVQVARAIGPETHALPLLDEAWHGIGGGGATSADRAGGWAVPEDEFWVWAEGDMAAPSPAVAGLVRRRGGGSGRHVVAAALCRTRTVAVPLRVGCVPPSRTLRVAARAIHKAAAKASRVADASSPPLAAQVDALLRLSRMRRLAAAGSAAEPTDAAAAHAHPTPTVAAAPASPAPDGGTDRLTRASKAKAAAEQRASYLTHEDALDAFGRLATQAEASVGMRLGRRSFFKDVVEVPSALLALARRRRSGRRADRLTVPPDALRLLTAADFEAVRVWPRTVVDTACGLLPHRLRHIILQYRDDARAQRWAYGGPTGVEGAPRGALRPVGPPPLESTGSPMAAFAQSVGTPRGPPTPAAATIAAVGGRAGAVPTPARDFEPSTPAPSPSAASAAGAAVAPRSATCTTAADGGAGKAPTPPATRMMRALRRAVQLAYPSVRAARFAGRFPSVCVDAQGDAYMRVALVSFHYPWVREAGMAAVGPLDALMEGICQGVTGGPRGGGPVARIHVADSSDNHAPSQWVGVWRDGQFVPCDPANGAPGVDTGCVPASFGRDRNIPVVAAVPYDPTVATQREFVDGTPYLRESWPSAVHLSSEASVVLHWPWHSEAPVSTIALAPQLFDGAI